MFSWYTAEYINEQTGPYWIVHKYIWTFALLSRNGFRGYSWGISWTIRDVAFSWIPLDWNVHFHGKLWIDFINLGYRIYHRYSYPILFTIYVSSTGQFYYLWMCVKLLREWQTVYTLIRRRFLWHLIWVFSVCSDLSVRNVEYGNLITSNPSKIILDPPLLFHFTHRTVWTKSHRKWS